jgi:hypothetical protein
MMLLKYNTTYGIMTYIRMVSEQASDLHPYLSLLTATMPVIPTYVLTAIPTALLNATMPALRGFFAFWNIV